MLSDQSRNAISLRGQPRRAIKFVLSHDALPIASIVLAPVQRIPITEVHQDIVVSPAFNEKQIAWVRERGDSGLKLQAQALGRAAKEKKIFQGVRKVKF